MLYLLLITPGEVTKCKTRRNPNQEFQKEPISEPHNRSKLNGAGTIRGRDHP